MFYDHAVVPNNQLTNQHFLINTSLNIVPFIGPRGFSNIIFHAHVSNKTNWVLQPNDVY